MRWAVARPLATDFAAHSLQLPNLHALRAGVARDLGLRGLREHMSIGLRD